MLNTIRKAVAFIAKPYLDLPTPESLEFIVVSGEREKVEVEKQNCFVYELLTSSGKRYEKNGNILSFYENYSSPFLPDSADNIHYSLKGNLRKILRPEETPDYEAVGKQLKQTLRDSGIMQVREGMYGIFGVTVEELRTLLYLAEDLEEAADQRIHDYRTRVSQILRPNNLECNLKIKPLLKPGRITNPPLEMQSYYGSGC